MRGGQGKKKRLEAGGRGAGKKKYTLLQLDSGVISVLCLFVLVLVLLLLSWTGDQISITTALGGVLSPRHPPACTPRRRSRHL